MRMSGRLFLLTLVALVLQTKGKSVEKTVKVWSFNDKICILLARFGSEQRDGYLKIENSMNWMADHHRTDAGSFRGVISVFDKNTHEQLQMLLNNFDKNAYTKVRDQVVQEFWVELSSPETVEFEFGVRESNQLYYFYLCDGQGEIIGAYKRRLEIFRERHEKNRKEGRPPSITDTWVEGESGTLITIKMTLTNSDRKHHSSDESHTIPISSWFTVINILIFGYSIYRVQQFRKIHEWHDDPLIMITVIIGLQLLAILMKMAHFFVYSHSGGDHDVLEVGSRVLYILSDGLLGCMFLLFSKGWGVTEVHLVFDFEIELVMGIVLLVARYAWVLVGYFLESTTDDPLYFYDGVHGKLEIVNMWGFFAWFIYSMRHEPALQKSRFEKLRVILLVLGTIHFTVRPIFVIILLRAPVEVQHFWSMLISYSTHAIVTAIFSAFLTRQKGIYQKIAISTTLGGLGELSRRDE